MEEKVLPNYFSLEKREKIIKKQLQNSNQIFKKNEIITPPSIPLDQTNLLTYKTSAASTPFPFPFYSSHLSKRKTALYNLFLYSLFLLVMIENVTSKEKKTYTNKWVIQVDGGEEIAREVAKQHNLIYVDKVMDNYYMVKNNRIMKRSLRSRSEVNKELMHDKHVLWMQQQVAKKRVKRDHFNQGSFNDPKWPRMWYLRQNGDFGMNVHKVWRKGYSGRGVVVSVMDDGVEKDHPDLKRNYDPKASYDVNDHDYDPQPRYERSNENKHGTRCAGEVAAESNNNICGVGIAFEARIGGIRMLDGDVTDGVEAQSLSLNPQHIDIYSASWGPDDDGRTVDGPGELALRAFEEGVLTGRKGLGSIFVWASGNGGQNEDNCNCDGYTNLIYTLSISSASEHGRIPWYSESCPSALATTFSSGSPTEKQIVTTDLYKNCTDSHTGTSASAPLAAGICALVLEANPYLTWRDLQHIVVLSAKPAGLVADDWSLNGVGRNVSHHFGFGLMDVGMMVDLAENWTNVPPQRKCVIDRVIPSKGLSVNSKLDSTLHSNGCHDSPDEVRYLEHVQIVVSISTHRRGELEVFLVSPSGTKSTMLTKRPKDISADGFNNWTFMTTHCWGEDPYGVWRLEIKNGASIYSPAKLLRWTLILYGSIKKPYDIPWLRKSFHQSSSSLSSSSSSSSSYSRHHNNFPFSHYPYFNPHPVFLPESHYYNIYKSANKSRFSKPGQRSHIQSKTRQETIIPIQNQLHNYYASLAFKPLAFSSATSSSSSSSNFLLSPLPYQLITSLFPTTIIQLLWLR